MSSKVHWLHLHSSLNDNTLKHFGSLQTPNLTVFDGRPVAPFRRDAMRWREEEEEEWEEHSGRQGEEELSHTIPVPIPERDGGARRQRSPARATRTQRSDPSGRPSGDQVVSLPLQRSGWWDRKESDTAREMRRNKHTRHKPLGPKLSKIHRKRISNISTHISTQCTPVWR